MRKVSFRKTIRVQKLQNKNRMVGQSFCTLNKNQRRRSPWLGQVWFEEGMKQEREQFIKAWEEETERLLELNPDLEII